MDKEVIYVEIDKVQLLILIILEDSGAVNPGTGMTLIEIGKELNENSDHKYSQTTVNRKVWALRDVGYVASKLKVNKADMFYITSKGKSMKEVWEFDNDKNADRKVTIYKEDIRWIKKKVPAKQERCTDCRRLLLVLLYICRKCDSNTITVLCNKNNRITKSALCKMADIDARNFNEVVRILQDLRILDAGIDKYNHLSLKMNEINMDGNEILAEDILYRKLKSIAKDKIREKVSSSVKNNCA